MLVVHIWDRSSLLDNLRIAMLMEAIAAGPYQYYIVVNSTLNFYSKLKLVLSSLPQEKMFLYPTDARLEGPFLHDPCLSRARVLHAQPSIIAEEYVANFVNF